MWIKVRHVPNKGGEMFPRRKNIPKGKTCQANRGRNKGGSWFYGEAKPSLDDGKYPSECK